MTKIKLQSMLGVVNNFQSQIDDCYYYKRGVKFPIVFNKTRRSC